MHVLNIDGLVEARANSGESYGLETMPSFPRAPASEAKKKFRPGTAWAITAKAANQEGKSKLSVDTYGYSRFLPASRVPSLVLSPYAKARIV